MRGHAMSPSRGRLFSSEEDEETKDAAEICKEAKQENLV